MKSIKETPRVIIKALFNFLTMYVLISFIGCQPNKDAENTRPNFIIIYTDDQRKDALGDFGNDAIITPNLDKYLAKGIKFTNANVVFALCSPSRAALLTGRYGSANGVLHLGSQLNQGEQSVASILKQNGYMTGMSGKWHIKQTPEEMGFSHYSYFLSNGTYYNRKIIEKDDTVRPKIHCDEYGVQRSIEFLETAKKSNEPFFLFHNTQTPHMNNQLIWDAKKSTLAKYEGIQMPVAGNRLDDLSDKPEYLQTVRNRTQARKYGYPDSLAIAQHTKEYYSVITEMDQFLGGLFESIEQLGLNDNTYIIFMSDNGWMLGDHGFTSKVLPYRPSTSVPMYVLGPEIKAGKNDNLVLNIDLAPTILSLAGITPPDQMHGADLSKSLNNTNVNVRDYFIYEGMGTYGGALPNLTVLTHNYRYIVTYKNESLDSVVYRELYDQYKDPLEMNNLIKDEMLSSKVEQFDQYIKKHQVEILNQ